MSSKFSFVELSDYYFSRNSLEIQITDSLVREYLRIKVYNFNGIKIDILLIWTKLDLINFYTTILPGFEPGIYSLGGYYHIQTRPQNQL